MINESLFSVEPADQIQKEEMVHAMLALRPSSGTDPHSQPSYILAKAACTKAIVAEL